MKMKNITIYNESLKLFEEYALLNHRYAKMHISDLIVTYGMKRQDLADILQIPIGHLCNIVNIANQKNVPFDILLKICMFFKVDIEYMNTPIKRSESKPSKFKRWTDENIKIFMDDMKNMSVKDVAKKWNIKEKSVDIKYKLFLKQIKEE